jgi:hypothetical protein
LVPVHCEDVRDEVIDDDTYDEGETKRPHEVQGVGVGGQDRRRCCMVSTAVRTRDRVRVGGALHECVRGRGLLCVPSRRHHREGVGRLRLRVHVGSG